MCRCEGGLGGPIVVRDRSSCFAVGVGRVWRDAAATSKRAVVPCRGAVFKTSPITCTRGVGGRFFPADSGMPSTSASAARRNTSCTAMERPKTPSRRGEAGRRHKCEPCDGWDTRRAEPPQNHSEELDRNNEWQLWLSPSRPRAPTRQPQLRRRNGSSSGGDRDGFDPLLIRRTFTDALREHIPDKKAGRGTHGHVNHLPAFKTQFSSQRPRVGE